MKKLQLTEEQTKKLDNFWYYYKFHVLGAAFILFCLVIFIRDMMGKVDYDYNIAFVGSYQMADEDSLKLQKWFEKNGEDLNGDGEIHVQISAYALTEDADPQVFAANQARFTVDAQEGSSMIFFMNEENYERFKDFGVFPQDRAEFIDMKDCKGFKEAGSPVSVQDMFGSMRLIFEDSKIAKDEEKQKYYDASEKLLKKFIGE